MNNYDKNNVTKIIENSNIIPGDSLTILSLKRETGLRLNEVLYLKKNSMEYDGETYSLYYSKCKRLQSSEVKTSNQDIVSRCAISKNIFELLTKQQQKTDELYPQNTYLFATDNYEQILTYVQFKSQIKD